MTLGGTNVYASDHKAIELVVEGVAASIQHCLRPHLTLMRPSLEKLCREALRVDIEKRLFAAIFGSLLTKAVVVCIPCISINGNLFRCYSHRDNMPTFRQHCTWTVGALQKQSLVAIRELELHCFPTREWGTWASAMNILAHLAYLGFAVYVDKDLFAWPEEVVHAIGGNLV